MSISFKQGDLQGLTNRQRNHIKRLCKHAIDKRFVVNYWTRKYLQQSYKRITDLPLFAYAQLCHNNRYIVRVYILNRGESLKDYKVNDQKRVYIIEYYSFLTGNIFAERVIILRNDNSIETRRIKLIRNCAKYNI